MKKKVITALLILSLLSACSKTPKTGASPTVQAATIAPTQVETTSFQKLDPEPGYDLLQTVFLILDKNSTIEDVLGTINSAELYYSDTKIVDSWYVETAYREPIESVYGSKLYDSDSIELTLRKTKDGVFYIESMEYYFHEKGFKAIYRFDRGYSEDDLSNAEEEFVFVDTNEKSNYTFRSVHSESKEDILNLGIAYEIIE